MLCKNARPRYCFRGKKYYHVRIDMSKLYHFTEFINRLHFYREVSYRTKLLKLDSGEAMEMPNVMRTVAHLTMINQCAVVPC